MTQRNRPCIMMVDDDSTVRELLLVVLGTRYNVICLPNGDDIVDLMSSYMPNLLILDINLPGMNGFEICSYVKSIPQFEHIPVLFLSCRRDDRSFVRALEVGGNSYLSKPFDVSALNERVEYLLGTYGNLKPREDA